MEGNAMKDGGKEGGKEARKISQNARNPQKALPTATNLLTAMAVGSPAFALSAAEANCADMPFNGVFFRTAPCTFFAPALVPARFRRHT